MPNIPKMIELFESIKTAINSETDGDNKKKEFLQTFMIRVFAIFDGIEGPNRKWAGISLVAPEDLPSDIPEINDDFLHDAWAEWSGRNS